MVSFEEEYKRLEPVINRLVSFALLGKKVVIKGKENFVKTGPNIIVGNHVGAFKDIAIILKIVPRTVYFTANKMIFSKDEFNRLIRRHLHRHLKNFGDFVDLFISPLKSLFVSFASANVAKIGTIPVDMDKKKKLALDQCQDYLKEGRAIITLQGLGRVMKKDPNPYVRSFKRGISFLAYKLYREEGISVPVTPLAIFGTQVPFLVPAKIKVNVGEPMCIGDYYDGELAGTEDRFRSALEKKVNDLIMDILKP